MQQATYRAAPLALLCLAMAALTFARPAIAETKTIDDWRVTCNQSRCVAHYESRGVQIVVLSPEPGKGRRIVLRLAPQAEVGRPAGIRLSGGWSAGLAVSSCDAELCQAAIRVESSAEVEQAFEQAHDGVVAYQAGSTMVIAPISLAGFTRAVAEIAD